DKEKLPPSEEAKRTKELEGKAVAQFRYGYLNTLRDKLKAENRLNQNESAYLEEAVKAYDEKRAKAGGPDKALGDEFVVQAREKAKTDGPKDAAKKWGLLGTLGLNELLLPLDDKTRSDFTPYGISGIMLGAALVFFAFIGFDSISTHAEEAVSPQRDVPIGILTSLIVCTILYVLVSAVITGMQAYPTIDTKAAVASAFRQRGEIEGGTILKASAALIALGGLAGMTSVLLITFLSQARVFLA